MEKKGAAVLLAALALVRRDGLPARLAIVGDGALRGVLEAQSRSLGLSEAVTFHGALPHDEALALIRRAAVLAAPSLPGRDGDREGLPTVILEAMAAGTPVVATAEAGIAEAVEDGVSGLLCPLADPPALAERLARVLTSPDLGACLGTEGCAVARGRFDLVRQTQKLEVLYDSIRAGGR